ncbi:MAG: molybdopterin molybdenumtransferase MoeA [Methylomonas sp.]|nr:MAG: molybdopterin molybdenumtransferase MoeA [Methylomonas sp.]
MTEICYPKTAKLLSVSQAQQNIRDVINSITDIEVIPIADGLGRILAETVLSPIDIPPQRNAAMDGYAFSSADITLNQPFCLKEIGTSWAGRPFMGSAEKNQCVRIFTGAVVPEFADSVIAQEQVERQANDITLPANTLAGKNIRAAGSDVKQFETLINTPKKLTACDLGLMAAAGVAQIKVKRRLTIGFFSTGDELTSVGQPLQSGQIYDSNRYMLAALLQDPNHFVSDLGVIRDDPELLERTLISAANAFDVLISTGGASVGDADFVKQILEKCGQINFWKLAIKPGKPLAFGKINNCWFFGLPGNPVAVLVTHQQFVRPALQQLSGLQPSKPLQLKAVCKTVLRKTPGRQEYQRGILNQTSAGELTVIAAGEQDSHQLKTTSLANCFIVLSSECNGVAIDEIVTVEPFDTYISV